LLIKGAFHRFLRDEHHLGNLHRFLIATAGEALQTPVSLGLVESAALHEHPLGTLDHLAVLQALAQAGILLPQRVDLLEARDGE
jgi:hypothetical protein